MSQYLVQSGPLKVVVHSASPLEAAFESLAWWGERQSPESPAGHRRDLDAVIEVKSLGDSRRRTNRFRTFSLLAEASGRSHRQAWSDLFGRFSNQN
jgi:hypothetical protein